VISLKRYLIVLSLLVFGCTLLSYSYASADAAKGEAIFNDIKAGNCKTCHDIGEKRKVGPGLKGDTTRHSREWLVKWITNPQVVWEGNDPDVQDLKKRMKKEDKPKTAMKPGKMSEEQIADVIDYLETLK
jgi:cytochrome c2